MEIERAMVLAIVMLGCACQGAAAPLVDADPSADAAPSATPPPAKPERKAEPTPPAPPEPTPFDTTTSIASRGGVSLPSTVTKEEILRAWPGVTLRPAEYVDDGIIVVGSAREPLLHLFHDQACFTGRGVVDPTGIEVGMALDEVPGMEHVLCEVATNADLLMRSEPCPRYDRSDIVLVCDLRADRAHRIFFDLGPEHLARAGEELRRADLAALGNPRVDAISLTTGLRGPLGPAEGEPPPPLPPASATGPSGAVVVLARTSDAPPHELRTDTLATPAAIEAALPGFTTRSIRYGGIAILRDGARIASAYPGNDGYIETVNLGGPGLVDVNGIGAGARFDDIAAVPGLTCEGMIDEGSPGYVECTVPSTGSSYTFDLHEHIEMEPLTLAQAKKKVGKRKAAVGISRPEVVGGSP